VRQSARYGLSRKIDDPDDGVPFVPVNGHRSQRQR